LKSKNIIHLDIKPDNILFKKKGVGIKENQLVICDFGLSNFVNEPLIAICGTPGYMAPELLAKPLDL